MVKRIHNNDLNSQIQFHFVEANNEWKVNEMWKVDLKWIKTIKDLNFHVIIFLLLYFLISADYIQSGQNHHRHKSSVLIKFFVFL